MGEIFNAVKERRSIRKYKNEEIPIEKIKRVIQAANWAPSNANSQPWQFIVIKGDYLKKVSSIYYEWAQEYVPKADYIPEENKTEVMEYSKDFGGAPVQIIVTYEFFKDDDNRSEEALMSACAAIQNLCLVALEEGLGTVWIAGHATHDSRTRSLLKIPTNHKIAAIIPIGYSADNPNPPARKDEGLDQKTTWFGFE
ncbi:nitroreductase family protein [Clostridiaceae bacterium M8S5]|nr:nitroreductase family protein [Clostridiaceae bacterium M8S5]